MEEMSTRGRGAQESPSDQSQPEPLVELAPDEAVVRALAQSAHPVEWAEAHKSDTPS